MIKELRKREKKTKFYQKETKDKKTLKWCHLIKVFSCFYVIETLTILALIITPRFNRFQQTYSLMKVRYNIIFRIETLKIFGENRRTLYITIYNITLC